VRTRVVIILGAGILALAVAGLGCSSTKQTEDMLAAVGFKQMPANTPEQQAHLQSLPRHKITRVARDGKTYFAYPDAKRQVLYVGTQAQYDEYQKLRLANKLAEERAQAANLNAESEWAPWGPWGGVDFVEPAPVFR
jgi:hypothetical protein